MYSLSASIVRSTTPYGVVFCVAAGAAPVFSVAASGLNVRSGPGAQNAPVAGSPLPAGTLVDGLEDQSGWKRVRAHGTVNGVAGVTGWVAASFLHPAVVAPA